MNGDKKEIESAIKDANKILESKIDKKYLDADGTLNEKGQKRYKKILEAGSKFRKIQDEANAESNKGLEMAKKAGYIKRNTQDVKEALRNFYMDNEDFRKSDSRASELRKKADEAWNDYRKAINYSYPDSIKKEWNKLSYKEQQDFIKSYNNKNLGKAVNKVTDAAMNGDKKEIESSIKSAQKELNKKRK